MASKAESPIAPPISEQNLSGKKIGVVLGIPSRGSVRLEWAAMLKSVTEPINMSWAIKTTIGKPVDQARNMIARYAIEFNANYLLFIDDDVLIPNQGLRRLVYQMEQNPDWDLLSGIYVTKDWEAPEPVIFGPDNPDGAYWDWRFGEQFPISGCGMGCCLVRTSAFAKMDAPWFHYRREPHGKNSMEEGEDLYFCRKLAEAGGTLMADGGLLCGHIDDDGRVHSLDFNSRPIQTADQELIDRYTMMMQDPKQAEEEQEIPALGGLIE